MSKSIYFPEMPLSNLHLWQNLPEILNTLQKWQDFFDTEISCFIRPLTKAHGYQIDYRKYIGLYSEKACEAYRTMWSEISSSNRTINHAS